MDQECKDLTRYDCAVKKWVGLSRAEFVLASGSHWAPSGTFIKKATDSLFTALPVHCGEEYFLHSIFGGRREPEWCWVTLPCHSQWLLTANMKIAAIMLSLFLSTDIKCVLPLFKTTLSNNKNWKNIYFTDVTGKGKLLLDLIPREYSRYAKLWPAACSLGFICSFLPLPLHDKKSQSCHHLLCLFCCSLPSRSHLCSGRCF